MLTLKRLAIYLITFLLCFFLALNLGNWRKVDNYVVGFANRVDEDENILNKDLVFVHVDTQPEAESACESFNQNRLNTINLIYAIINQADQNNGPKGIVLDLWFGRDNTQQQNLIQALQTLQFYGIPVYVAYNVNAAGDSAVIEDTPFDNLEKAHLTEVYDLLANMPDLPAGSARYHTNFFYEPNMASYEHDLYFSTTDNPENDILIESLVSRVAQDLGDSKTMVLEEKRRGSIVPFASYKEMQMRSYFFSADSTLSINSFQPYEGMNPMDQTIDMDEKIVIVGDPANDVSVLGDKYIPRPYVVTWAISDLLDGNTRLKLPLESNKVIIGQMLFFAFMVALVFALFFKYARSLQTKPLILAILSFLVVMILLFLYYKVILTFKAVIPVGQTVVAMIVAALLCWRFAYKFLVTGIAEGAQKYDIFISYSHGPHAEWVEKNVYEPLAAYRKPNGDKLNVFFDKKSIGIGEAFTSKYMWAIVDTKLFVPVVTEEYYGKNHCKNELDLAVNRYVEKLIDINMLAFSHEAVPDPYRTFNYIDVHRNKNFIDLVTGSIKD